MTSHRALCCTPAATRIVFLAALLGAALTLLVWRPSPLAGETASGATLTVLRGTAAVLKADGTALSPAPSGVVIGAGIRSPRWLDPPRS